MRYTLEAVLEMTAKHYENLLIDKINSEESSSCHVNLELYKQHKEVYLLFKRHKFSSNEREAHDLTSKVKTLLHPLKSLLIYFLKYSEYPPNSTNFGFDIPTSWSILTTIKHIK